MPSPAVVSQNPESQEIDDEDKEAVARVMPLRPRLISSHSVDETAASKVHVEIKTRSVSQPNIHRRYSRPMPPSQKGSDRKSSSSAALESHMEELETAEPEMDDEEGPSELEAIVPRLTKSPVSVPDLGRTDSVTTTSTSTGCRSHHSQIPPITTIAAEKHLEQCYPEPVQIRPDARSSSVISSPDDFEKNYPEVAIDPVSAIKEDNISLFSDGGSMPMTTRSATRASSQQKKFSLFKAPKRNSSHFAAPTLRFFASGKYLIGWTRYGGICFDVGSLNSSKTHPINFGDIILAAGGSQRYAIIARYQEVSRKKAD